MLREAIRGLGPLLMALSMAGMAAAGCDDGPAVPFKHDQAQRGSYQQGSPVQPGGEAAQAPGAQGGSALPGLSFPAGTTAIEVGGRKLALPAGQVWAALQAGRAEQPALLLLAQGAEGGLELQLARAAGAAGWEAPAKVVELLPSGGPCSARNAALALLAEGMVAASAEVACGAAGGAAPVMAAVPAGVEAQGATPGAPAGAIDLPEPPGTTPTPTPAAAPTPAPTPAPVAAATVERRSWGVEFQPNPGAVLSLAVPVQGAEQPAVDTALRAADLDGDGHSDLGVGLVVREAGIEETRVEVQFLNRAAGLSFESDQPELALLALADQAKSDRRSKPARARALSRQVLAVHGALCRESGRALLRVNGEQGLPCGASVAAGRAASVMTALLAADGRMLDALELHAQLNAPAYRLTDNDWDRVRTALAARVESHGLEWRRGPSVVSPTGPAVRSSALAFLDEQRLLLRGAPAQSYDLATGQLTPVGMPGDVLITDPSKQLAVIDIVRSCEGYHLRIVPAARAALGPLAGKSLAEPLFAAAPPPSGARCPELSSEQRADRGGYRVLSWSARGVLLAHGHALSLLALDAQGKATAPAAALADGAELSAGSGGELSANGRFFALPTTLGLALRDRKSGATRLVALPEGTQPVTDLALSPSGARVALLRGGVLYVGAPAPTAPAPNPTAPPQIP